VCCAICELVYICICEMRCGTCEAHEAQLRLLILPVLENSCSSSLLFINVVNSSVVIVLKGHTVGVVHVRVPKDFIYLKCSSNAPSLLFVGIRIHYRPRCQVWCQICHVIYHLSTRMPRQYVDSTMKTCLVVCGGANFRTHLSSIPFY